MATTLTKSKLLAEFEKRYEGDPSQTEAICSRCARDLGVDVEFYTDFIYMWRYAEEESLEYGVEEVVKEEEEET